MADKLSVSKKYNGIVTFWAVTECGLGGLMHAFKMPFTGIIVGSIATICLFLISKYSQNKSKSIIEATAIVVMIKLIVSPHSPWQAYVALLFQSSMAILFLTGKSINSFQSVLFAVINQVESAVQKILIFILIFGQSFFKSLDSSMHQVVGYFGMHLEVSLVYPMFIFYVFVHFIVGIILGTWLTKIEKQLAEIKINTEKLPEKGTLLLNNRYSFFIWVIGLVFTVILVYLVDSQKAIFVMLRVVLVTLVFIYLLTPVVKFLIKKVFRNTTNQASVSQILQNLPLTLEHYNKYLTYANAQYTGVSKIKYFILILIYASMQNDDK
ncbi:MAG: hypothetical protein R2774_06520 [Saprospiraceae bacterium]